MQKYMEDRIRNIEILLEKQQEQLNKQSNDIYKIYLLLKSKENKENKKLTFDINNNNTNNNNTSISSSNTNTTTTTTVPSSSSSSFNSIIPTNSNLLFSDLNRNLEESNISNQISNVLNQLNTNGITNSTITNSTSSVNKKLFRSDGTIRQKRKRALLAAKELCRSLPNLMSSESITGKRPRSRSQSNLTPIIENNPFEVLPTPPPSSSSFSSFSSSSSSAFHQSTSDFKTTPNQIRDCDSYLSLYNLLNSIQNFENQYVVILQMTQILNDPNNTQSIQYHTFIESQGGVIIFVRWLRDISNSLHSLPHDLIMAKISIFTSNFYQANPSLHPLIITGSKTGNSLEITFDKNSLDIRVYIQIVLNIFDKIAWTKDLVLATRIDKILKSFYKSYTAIGNFLLTQPSVIYRNLGTEYIEFSHSLKAPWTKYRQLIS